jgi:hypothetical protein
VTTASPIAPMMAIALTTRTRAGKSSSSTSWLGLAAARLGSDRLDAPNEPEPSLFFWLVKRASQLGSAQLASWLVARPNNNLLHKVLINI